MKRLLILSLLVLAVASATTASAVQLFDFDAQAILPASVGADAEVYGLIVNGSAVATPLPLDYTNFEYTIVVTGLTMDSMGASSIFSGGMVKIYKDASTAADWTNTASFADGEVILSGPMANFQHTMFTATLGSGAGYVDWTGGTELHNIAPIDRLSWPFLTGISRSATQVLPGFTEKWDGKVEPSEDIVANEDKSWSELKGSFQ